MARRANSAPCAAARAMPRFLLALSLPALAGALVSAPAPAFRASPWATPHGLGWELRRPALVPLARTSRCGTPVARVQSTGPFSTGSRFGDFANGDINAMSTLWERAAAFIAIAATSMLWGRAAALGGIVATITGLVLPWRSLFETSESRRAHLEVQAILAALAPLSAADERQVYVQRDELEETLKSFVKLIDPYGYMVVVGPKGAGKSTLVSHVLKELGRGVLIVQIEKPSATVPELEELVLNTALQPYAPSQSWYATSTPLMDGDLAERLQAAAKAGREEGREEGWLPTLVFEITSSGDGTLIKNACTVLKALAADNPLCHGLLVLSSSFAVAELTDDRYRQRFLRVGAFSRDEASAYLDAQFKARVPEEIATVAAVTTVKERILPLTKFPSAIRRLTEELAESTNEADFVARAEAWASKFEKKARADVEGAGSSVLNIFIRDETGKERCFSTRNLMRELLDTGGPIKLPSPTFDVPPDLFASKIRTSQKAKAAFNLDLVSDMVDFASAAHRKAAAELLSLPPPTSSSSF